MSKKNIPNLLTISRLILTPLIIILGVTKHFIFLLLVLVIACLTDLLDGKLARLWNVSSQLGAKLDAVCDKIFAIGVIISLSSTNPLLWVLIILEIVLGVSNLYYYSKLKVACSLMVGKMKTTSLFITLILCYISILIHQIEPIVSGFLYMTIHLQILSLLYYYLHYQQKRELDKTIVVPNLQDLK